MKNIFCLILFLLPFFTNTVVAQFDKVVCEEILSEFIQKESFKKLSIETTNSNASLQVYHGDYHDVKLVFKESFLFVERKNNESPRSLNYYIPYSNIIDIIVEDGLKENYNSKDLHLSIRIRIKN